jgi:hypothetical protein
MGDFMKIQISKAAQELHAYMEFRAQREGQPHELTLAFYQDAINKGIMTFFGVTIGPDGLEWDTKQPQFFKEWRKARQAHEHHPDKEVIQ